MPRLPPWSPLAAALAALLPCAASGQGAAPAPAPTPPPASAPTPSAPASAASPASAATFRLPEVVVRASADASAAGLTPAYPGGQVARGGRVGILGSGDVMTTPFSLTSYTQQLIQDQQAASVGDVLQNDPAVRIARGFGNYQQLYMVRGLPVYSDDMAYNGLYGLLPRQYLAAELIERVEVLRGASAFLNGAAPGGSGIGGAINIMPKRATNEPLTELTLGAESGGQGLAALDVARRFGPDAATGLRLNAVRRDGDTAVDGEGRTLSVLALGLDHHSGNLRLSADIGYQNHRLSASQPSVSLAAGVPVPNAPDASASFAQPWSYSNERDTFGTVRAEYDLRPDLTAWLAVGGREGVEAARFANPTVTAKDGTTTAYRFDNARRDFIATGEVGLRGRFTTGAVAHTVTASAAVYRDRSKNAYGLSDFSGFASDLQDPVASPLPPVTFRGGALDDPRVTSRTRTSSVAIADVLSFADDRVRLTLGARHQRIESLNYDYNTGDEGTPYSAGRTTPVAGLLVKLTPAVSLYGNYIEGLVRGDTAPASTPTQPVANPGEVLPPYRSRQVEVGVKLDTGRFGATLGAFRTKKPVGGAVDAVTNRFEVVGEQTNEGVEFNVFGEPVRGLKLLGGATWLSTDLDGRDAIGAPRRQANLGAEWAVPGVAGLSLDARAVYTSSQYADAANTQRVPAWHRFDLGARYLLAVGERSVVLRARVDNLTDRHQWVSAGGFPGYGYLTLGAPRTFVVSGSVDF